jgi:hypothetical protein
MPTVMKLRDVLEKKNYETVLTRCVGSFEVNNITALTSVGLFEVNKITQKLQKYIPDDLMLKVNETITVYFELLSGEDFKITIKRCTQVFKQTSNLEQLSVGDAYKKLKQCVSESYQNKIIKFYQQPHNLLNEVKTQFQHCYNQFKDIETFEQFESLTKQDIEEKITKCIPEYLIKKKGGNERTFDQISNSSNKCQQKSILITLMVTFLSCLIINEVFSSFN